jgi:hypothetical protein
MLYGVIKGVEIVLNVKVLFWIFEGGCVDRVSGGEGRL